MYNVIDFHWLNKHTSDNSLSYRKWYEAVKARLALILEAGPAAKLPPLTPLDVPEDWNGYGVILTARALNHILYGDYKKPTGGHMYGYGWYARLHGNLGTEFPKSWTVQNILNAASEILSTLKLSEASDIYTIDYQGITVQMWISRRDNGRYYLTSFYPLEKVG